MTCVQLYEPKVFIYLAGTVFLAANADEFLVYFLTLPRCLLCLPMELWSYGPSIYVHTQDTIHILTHICTAVKNHKSMSLHKRRYRI